MYNFQRPAKERHAETEWCNGCHGSSCNQGRAPCRDRCGAEQAVPSDSLPNLSWWRRLLLRFWI